MASGSVQRRCVICRREGKSGWEECLHREAVYYICFRYGKRWKSKKIGPSKKDAERVLYQTLSSINHGTYDEPNPSTFKDFSAKWLEDYAKPRIKVRTFRTYEATVRRVLVPYLGRYLLTDIKQETIEKLMAELLKTVTPKTVNNALRILKSVLKGARRWRYIKEDPSLDVKGYKVVQEEMDNLTPAEIGLLLKHSREPFRTLFLTAILTGMRRGEVLALQWGDIDWNSDTVFVRRSIIFDSKIRSGDSCRWHFDTPKTRNSVRALVMSPRLKEALEIHRLTALGNEWDLVFTNKEGRPIDPSHMLQREFTPALRCAGLRQVRFHDLRHTYASLLINQGENVKFVQSQMGHASCQTTLDRYGHLMPVKSNEVGLRIDGQVFIGSDQSQVECCVGRFEAKVAI